MDPVYGYQSVNVEAQRRYNDSLLNWVREMIHLRKSHPVFARGSMEFVRPENRKIFAFTRTLDGETVLCVFNLSQHAQPVELDLAHLRGATPVEMIGETEFPKIGELPYQLALAPRGFYWFLLKGGKSVRDQG
jgi:maltose alpha-D-glucosyltransferase / alpha-amylase